MTTAIEWTDETWNVVTGCDRVSPGCDHCYIERTIPFRIEARRDVLTARVTLAEKHLADVLHALDHTHIEQGCHCAPGPCALSAPWVPDSIRHTPHGQPRDDDDHVATEAQRLIAHLCPGEP